MNPDPIDYSGYQKGSHDNAEARRRARLSLVGALQIKAKAEHDFRKAMSISFAKHRNKGKGVGEAEIHARADAAEHALTRDMADAEAKGASARLAELEGERASLRQLAEWSRAETGDFQ